MRNDGPFLKAVKLPSVDMSEREMLFLVSPPVCLVKSTVPDVIEIDV